MSFRDDHPETFWFLIIMIAIFFLWLFTGGPERSAPTRNDKFIEPVGPLGSGRTYDEPIYDPYGPAIQNPLIRQQ